MVLALSVRIHALAGWVELEDAVNGYEIHKDTRSQQAVTWRKQEINSPYVEGTFTNEAVRENVVEPVAIYVRGESQFELMTRVKVITDALGQLNFDMEFTVGNAKETWHCFASEYTVETQQEFVHGLLAVVRASVPRLPTVAMVEV